MAEGDLPFPPTARSVHLFSDVQWLFLGEGPCETVSRNSAAVIRDCLHPLYSAGKRCAAQFVQRGTRDALCASTMRFTEHIATDASLREET
jgi:hypothetical protein